MNWMPNFRNYTCWANNGYLNWIFWVPSWAFLRKLSENNTIGVARILEPAKLDVIEQTSVDLKKDLVMYLHELEPLIIASEKHLKLNLIEINIRLKQGLAQVLIDFQSAKKAIFDYCKPRLKNKHALIFCNYG